MRLPAFYRWLLLVVGISISGISLAQDAGWPRQIQDSRGVHTLDHKPARIVSTSVTLTGSLLAIDAPVVASGATTPNNRFADDQGFMRQWSDVAKARHVARLYIGEPNAETVAAQMPDLILISATAATPRWRFTISSPLSRRRSSSIMTIKAGRVCSRNLARSPVRRNRPPRE
ncbi:ferrienterobactin-binding periplasmic protein [Salmonella enterica subsp. enterica]|uniref:Ferrienterobactin-binding periplasmic protein n=1 Tax=Salmonella enterica I TaxID=59201 RepID=A0A379UNN8_SALET|nr:ferrienterobactin-binding periplasmic protein [Salmonella enterica subsp. enterica]